MSASRPVVLVLAGLEPLGRAGLLVDVEAVRANGAQPIGIATCNTVQDGARALIEPTSPKLLRGQLEQAFAERDVAAVKSGLIPTPALLELIAKRIPPATPWIFDPVVRSSSGAKLSKLRWADVLAVARPGVVLTPNLDELRRLTGLPAGVGAGSGSDELRRRAVQYSVAERARRAELGTDLAGAIDARIAAARWLVQRGFGAVIVKGGHAELDATDLLVTVDRVHRFAGKRLTRAASVRGTGCRFASALATAIASGAELPLATRRAKAYVRRHLTSSAL